MGRDESLAASAAPRRGVLDEFEDEPSRLQRYGRIAGVLYLAGALSSLNNLWLGPGAEPAVFWLALLGAATGIVCLLLPWRRLSIAWLHAIVVLATVEVTLSVELIGPVSAWYYSFIAVFAALAFRRRPEVAVHVGLVAVALALPAFLADEPREHLLQAAVGAPSLALVALVIAYLRERLEIGQRDLLELSRQDPLTGVGNYRHMLETVHEAIVSHSRHERRFALVLLDLDGFKAINDTEGHLEGDRVLREVGAALRGAVRAEDRVFRQGGDEFSVLAPESGAAEAAVLTDRLQRAVRSVSTRSGELSACAAWAIFPEDGENAEELLGRADSEVMAHKRGVPTERAAPSEAARQGSRSGRP